MDIKEKYFSVQQEVRFGSQGGFSHQPLAVLQCHCLCLWNKHSTAGAGNRYSGKHTVEGLTLKMHLRPPQEGPQTIQEGLCHTAAKGIPMVQDGDVPAPTTSRCPGHTKGTLPLVSTHGDLGQGAVGLQTSRITHQGTGHVQFRLGRNSVSSYSVFGC